MRPYKLCSNPVHQQAARTPLERGHFHITPTHCSRESLPGRSLTPERAGVPAQNSHATTSAHHRASHFSRLQCSLSSPRLRPHWVTVDARPGSPHATAPPLLGTHECRWQSQPARVISISPFPPFLQEEIPPGSHSQAAPRMLWIPTSLSSLE